MRRLVSICKFLLVFGVLGCTAQYSCQQYNISTNALCLAMTPYPVFLPGSLTQEDLAQNIFRVLNISSAKFGRDVLFSLSTSPLAPQCVAAFRSLLCSVYIPGCNNSRLIWFQSIRSPVCLSSCLEVERICGPAIASELGVNCSAVNPLNGEPVFMNDTDTKQDPVYNSTVYCTRALREQYCNLPILTDDAAPFGFCNTRCEYVLWKRSTAESVRRVLYVIGWINFLMNLFVILSYILDPAKRIFPNSLSVFIAVNYAAQGLNVAMHSIVGSSRVLCKSTGRANDQGDYWLCGLGGAIYTFTIIGGACWIFILSTNLVHFVMRGKHVPKWFQVPFHVFAWGVPLILMIIPLATRKFSGREPSLLFCSIVDRRMFDAVTIIPYFSLFGLSILMAIGVIVYLTVKMGRVALIAQSYLLGFVICLSLFEMLHIFVRLYNIRLTETRFAPKYIGWMACEFAYRFVRYGLSDSVCKRPSTSSTLGPVAFAMIIQLIGQSLVWIFFGFTAQNILFWKRVLKERSIRSILFHTPPGGEAPEKSLDRATLSMQQSSPSLVQNRIQQQ